MADKKVTDAALEVLSAPLAAYQRALDVAGDVTRESFKQAQHTTGQVSQATEKSYEQQVEQLP